MNTMTLNKTVEAVELNPVVTRSSAAASRKALVHAVAQFLLLPTSLLAAWMIYRIVSEYLRMMELMNSLPGLYFT